MNIVITATTAEIEEIERRYGCVASAVYEALDTALELPGYNVDVVEDES